MQPARLRPCACRLSGYGGDGRSFLPIVCGARTGACDAASDREDAPRVAELGERAGTDGEAPRAKE